MPIGCQHGASVIKTVWETRPEVYVKVVASLLPREVHAEVTGPTHEERVAELAGKPRKSTLRDE